MSIVGHPSAGFFMCFISALIASGVDGGALTVGQCVSSAGGFDRSHNRVGFQLPQDFLQ